MKIKSRTNRSNSIPDRYVDAHLGTNFPSIESATAVMHEK